MDDSGWIDLEAQLASMQAAVEALAYSGKPGRVRGLGKGRGMAPCLIDSRVADAPLACSAGGDRAGLGNPKKAPHGPAVRDDKEPVAAHPDEQKNTKWCLEDGMWVAQVSGVDSAWGDMQPGTRSWADRSAEEFGDDYLADDGVDGLCLDGISAGNTAADQGSAVLGEALGGHNDLGPGQKGLGNPKKFPDDLAGGGFEVVGNSGITAGNTAADQGRAGLGEALGGRCELGPGQKGLGNPKKFPEDLADGDEVVGTGGTSTGNTAADQGDAYLADDGVGVLCIGGISAGNTAADQGSAVLGEALGGHNDLGPGQKGLGNPKKFPDDLAGGGFEVVGNSGITAGNTAADQGRAGLGEALGGHCELGPGQKGLGNPKKFPDDLADGDDEVVDTGDTSTGNTAADQGDAGLGEALDGRTDFGPGHDASSRLLRTYTALISACVKGGRVEKAMELCAEMQLRGLSPEVTSYTTLISACEKGEPNVITDDTQYNTLISLCEKGQIEEAIELLTEMQPESSISATLASACEKGYKVEAIECCYKCRERLRRSLDPEVTAYTALISACVKGGKVEKAMELFAEMKRRGMKPEANTYTALISACEEYHKLEKALELIAEMAQTGVPAQADYTALYSVNTFDILISACEKDNDAQKAVDLFGEMQLRGGLIPEMSTYRALSRVCAKSCKVKEAMELFADMQQKGLVPGASTVEKAIELYKECSKGAWSPNKGKGRGRG